MPRMLLDSKTMNSFHCRPPNEFASSCGYMANNKATPITFSATFNP